MMKPRVEEIKKHWFQNHFHIAMADTAEAKQILDKVDAQGLVVREKKTSGAPKDEITAAVRHGPHPPAQIGQPPA